MRPTIWALAIALFLVGCDKKPTEGGAETTSEAEAPVQHPHVDTNREAFKAAGRAAKQIEDREAEHNAKADEAMNAGKE